MIKATIITIGDELLIGQVIDTNSSWIASELLKVGIQLQRRVAIGDTKQAIIQALTDEQKHADILLLTGGLGPTSDDITKPVLCDYFGGQLILNEKVLEHITKLFKDNFKREVTERNRQQAYVPDTCTIIHNAIGTAPGMLFTQLEKTIVSMPGVPAEMQLMMQEQVIPLLLKRYQPGAIFHTTSVVYGLGESIIADMLVDFEKQLPAHIKLAYLPNHGLVRLRLTGTASTAVGLQENVMQQKEILQMILAAHIIAEEDSTMQQILARLLSKRNETVCTAESCTGGYIAHLLTLLPGSSSWYAGSIVSYSYEAKENLLDVQHKNLLQYGAVSEEVVQEMARGALNKLKTTYSIAVSGIMGPDGGMEGKPTGTVWVAVASAKNMQTKKFHFRYQRAKNIEITAMNALNMLRAFITEDAE